MNIGGMSTGRGIMLTSGDLQVKVIDDGKGNLRFQTCKIKTSSWRERVSKIPFLRGLFSVGRAPILFILLVGTILIDFGAEFVGDIGGNWMDVLDWAGVILLAAVIVARLFFLRDMLRYHGAEHMVINTYEAGQELTVENILGASRTHPRCGTMWAIYLLFLGLPCALFIPYVSVAFLLTVTVSYELYHNAGRFKILRGLSKAGMWLQKNLTTAIPEQKHLEAALQCMARLIVDN